MDHDESLVQVFTTLATRDDALELARSAVEARAAACVQVVGPIASVYRWEGTVQEDSEFLCLLKAPGSRLEPLLQFVRDHHPYDTPEITAVPSAAVDDRYLAWAVAETSA
ncbi:MAG: divalent-cation tolerance protein CutA [Actinomycetota bacterium]|nr:divalent-cation tolerance protein CutA [Actinomycetota bacterium]